MNTLSNIDNYFIPNTLDGMNTIQENINDNALLIDGTNSMSADLDVGGFNIKNLDAGIANNEAVNVGQLNAKANISYVDTQDALKANISYVDTQDNLKVNKSGDTMTGTLTINSSAYINGKPNIGEDGVRLHHSAGTDRSGYIDCRGQRFVIRQKTDLNGSVERASFSDTETAINQQLNMSSNKIINVANGSNPNDAVNFSQLTATGNYVLKSGDTMTGPLMINNVLNLNGGTATDITADFSNNTYIRFGEAGASSDWAYLRQIGGSNDISIALDFHDNGTDGTFQLRSINSIANPDTINTFFTASPAGITVPNVLANAGITISRAGTTTDAEQPFRLQKNNNYIGMNPYFDAGAYNPLVQSGDKGIIFSSGYINSGASLVIAPHSSSSRGIRINNTEITLGGAVTVTGSIDMSSIYRIRNMAYPVVDTDAANVAFVNDRATKVFIKNPPFNAYTIADIDRCIIGNLSGSHEIYLDSLSSSRSRLLYIKNMSATGDNMGINPPSGGSIDGFTTKRVISYRKSILLVADNFVESTLKWFILSDSDIVW